MSLFWRNFRHWLHRDMSLTTSGATGGENFVKMTIFLFQCCDRALYPILGQFSDIRAYFWGTLDAYRLVGWGVNCKHTAKQCRRNLTHWPLGDLTDNLVNNFQANSSDWWPTYLLRKYPKMNAPQDLFDNKSTLIQVMACCRQAAIHYLRQCCPRSLSPYGVTRPQGINPLAPKAPNVWGGVWLAPQRFWMQFHKCNFQSWFTDWYLHILSWWCTQMNVMGRYFGDKSTLVLVMVRCLLGTKPLPEAMLKELYIGHGELRSVASS